jgi:metallo-beta-lactamase family protein
MKITFLGATGTVTGSKYLIECGATRALVDCGLFQGLKQLRLRNRAPLPFAPRDLDAVLLTHAHLDHSGYLPLLVKNGFRGPVYCTPATSDLCAILLPDSGHLQEEEAEFANRHGYSRHHPALPLYTRADAERCLEQLEPVEFGSEMMLGDDLRFRLHPAGHLLGAAMVHLFGGGTDLLFTGDLGRPHDLLLPPPTVIEEASHLVVESTYGDRLHTDSDPLDLLEKVVTSTASRGGSVVIPSFAVGRAQLVLLLLHQLKSAGRIPDIPVFLDSPMAVKATEVFSRHVDGHRLERAECDAVCATARVVNSVAESKEIDRMRFPRIILSASGMATGGRVLHHLKALAPDPRNTVLFVGFQAAGTRGGTMIAGANSVKIHGEYVPVRAEIAVLDNISGHADYQEILEWLGHFRRPPRSTFITHGEPVAADALRLRIEEALGWHCVVPEYRESVELPAAQAGRSERAAGTPHLPLELSMVEPVPGQPSATASAG